MSSRQAEGCGPEYIVEPDPFVSYPSGVVQAQHDNILRRTSVSGYSDGDTDYLVVVTRLDGGDEADPGWFIDAQWIAWVRDQFPGWTFIEGDGSDGQGPWFAQWHRWLDPDPGIWVALGQRPHQEEEEV